MEEYPEELRTPPVGLISLVGCPELHPSVSAFLHSEQPPINTLALPDFSKISIFSPKLRGDPLASPKPPAGILKRDWLQKHRTRIPAAVAAFFRSDHVAGDPSRWLQVCTDLENLKAVVRGRNIRLMVVLVLTSSVEELSEDLMIALRKRAEIDPKYLVTFVQNDASELRQSLNRLASLFAELCNTHYREEGRKVRTRIEKKIITSAELNIRYCFKVAIYAEFRRDWAESLRFYEEAYRTLREMAETTTRLPPAQRLVEVRAVAEQLYFKVSTLLLHGGKVLEAITWCNKHIATYRQLVGTPEIAFIHWDWFSRQFLVFAQLLETSSASTPTALSSRFGTSEHPLTEWEFQPAYYYQLAANYLREKRDCLDKSLSATNPEFIGSLDNPPDSVLPSVFLGQYSRLFEHGDIIEVLPLSDAEYISYAIAEAQRFQDSYEIIALFRKAYDLFISLKAPRLASNCSNKMAKEYFTSEDFVNAKKLFDGVADHYRQEGWVTLLWETLGYLRECARRLCLAKEFVEYSLEMASLPIFSDGLETSRTEKECGPAGLPALKRREIVQQEVFRLLKGEDLKGEDLSPQVDGECNLHVSEDQPVHLVIDPISPLRVVLLASVAFHEQSVKPGSPAMLTLSLLSHLPHSVELDQLKIEFNQPQCNFTIVNEMRSSTATYDVTKSSDHTENNISSLTLESNRWLRLTYDVKPANSGKLECLSVIAKIGTSFVICSRAESAASMEALPLWKFEDRLEALPTKDPGLAFSGQKSIQVEEPEPQVDLILSASAPALVGESFVVPVTVVSKGHAIHAGELKINLVDAKGDGLLMSPRADESFPSDNHHVELLSISSTGDEDELDNIRKIQQSFGVVSVPFLEVGESWFCKLQIKWHRPKSIILYVSLGYSPTSSEASVQRVNVHRSLQIEGKVPVNINHRFTMLFRREPLLLSTVKSLPGSIQNESIARNETSILILTARNCCEIPLQVVSLSITPDKDEDAVSSCSLQQIGAISDGDVLLVPGEEFKAVFTVTPKVESPAFKIGTAHLEWKRDSKQEGVQDSAVVTEQKLPEVNVENPLLVASLDCPPHAILGSPFSMYIRVQNLTNLLQEIKLSLGDSHSFVFSGPHVNAAFVLPKTEHLISYKLLPLTSGSQQIPRITITSVRYSAALSPSVAEATIFVYPSEPEFGIGGRK